jgi:hypothetical protein
MPLRLFTTRAEAWTAALVAAAAFVVYVATLYPDVPGGDSGELIGAVAGGGVIHPPGYPLYALLARLYLHIPFGTLAWRVNLFSATCDAVAAGTLSLAVSRWTRSPWAGLAAAALFAFAPGVWLYAVSAEVFALNNLFVSVVLLLCVLYAEERDRTYAYAGAFASGLALSNHLTILFVVVPLGAWMLHAGRRDLLRPRPLVTMVALVAIGLLPYLLLVTVRHDDAVVSWGTTNTWSGFWTHVLRRDYGPLRVANGRGGATPSGTLDAWFGDLVGELGWWGGPLLVTGLVAAARSGTHLHLGRAVTLVPVVGVLVFALLWGLPASDALHREILARFWQEPDVVCFAWCGWGVAAIGSFARSRSATSPAWRLLEPTVAGGLALASLGLHAREMDHHANRVVRDYGAEILRAAPMGAVLLTKGDLITNTTRYLQLAEGVRPDVHVVDQELLGYEWYGRQIAARYPDIRLPRARYAPGASDGFFMKELLDENFGRWPILICGGVKEGDLTADATYGRWPYGLCEMVHRGSEPVNVDDWLRESEAALPRIAFGAELRPRGSWEDIAWGDYWQVRVNRGIQLISIAGADPSRRRYLATAATIFQGVIESDPSPPPQVYKNLALAIGRQGLETADDRARAAAAWREYLKVAPPDDPQLPGIQKELARLSPR